MFLLLGVGLCDSMRNRMYKVEETLGVVLWENHFLSFTVKKISAENLKKEMKLPEVRLEITGLWCPASLLVSSQGCLTANPPGDLSSKEL